MAGVKDPARYERKQSGTFATWPIWDGPPVVCVSCGQSGVPTWVEGFGWQMPKHGYSPGISTALPCPGSGAKVDRPEHATTKRLRAEQQEIPEAVGIAADENPMEGPST